MQEEEGEVSVCAREEGVGSTCTREGVVSAHVREGGDCPSRLQCQPSKARKS